MNERVSPQQLTMAADGQSSINEHTLLNSFLLLKQLRKADESEIGVTSKGEAVRFGGYLRIPFRIGGSHGIGNSKFEIYGGP